jgi:HEAT repeat protein
LLSAATSALPGIPAPISTLTFAQTPNSGSSEQAAAAAQVEIQQQRNALENAASSEAERIEAARRLLSHGDHVPLRQALGSGVSSRIIAVAEALADIENPDPLYIDELRRQLGPDVSRDVADAVARALVNYKENETARQILADFVRRTNVSERARVVAIRAMGSLTDKKTAGILVEELLKGDQSSAVSDAAAEALGRMTGLSEYGNDVTQWEQWWRRQQTLPPQDFERERQTARTFEGARAVEQLAQLAQDIRAVVDDGHRQLATEAQREEYVLRFLKHGAPQFRGAAANLVILKKQNGETISNAVVEQLRGCIGDSSPDVRKLAAQAIEKINDRGAVKPILAQLQRERIPGVKAALISALAPTQDASAAPELLTQLRDTSVQVAEAAARTLGALGPEIAKNPDLAAATANALSDALQRTGNARGMIKVREAVVQAMIPLKNSPMMLDLVRLLRERPENTPQVRNSAIRALANLNVDPIRKDDIAQQIAPMTRDSVPGVRLEAVRALGIVGGPAQAEALYFAMDPSRETDKVVREEAWRSLKGLLDKFEVQTLFNWATQRFANEPEKKLEVYLALNRILERAPQTAETEGELNLVRSSIGALYVNSAIANPQEAIRYLEPALKYYDSQLKAATSVGEVQKNMVNAYLWSKKYKDAIQFAESRINRNRENQTDMGLAIQEEVRRLEEAKQFENQLALLNETENLSIQGIYRDRFNEKRKEARERKPSLHDLFREYYAEQRFTPLYT